jgi:hypothetical protein
MLEAATEQRQVCCTSICWSVCVWERLLKTGGDFPRIRDRFLLAVARDLRRCTVTTDEPMSSPGILDAFWVELIAFDTYQHIEF